QKVVFKNTTAKVLYELYMDAKKHSLVTGAPVKITPKEGTSYSAHGDYITGKNLCLVKDKLIVQTWRASDWDKTDTESIFIIRLEPKGKNVVLQMTHANVPKKQADEIKKGWHTYYWEPWKKHLAGKH
ncbi:MAG TPA: SRPBCC domain-containing protein, partial [Bacteroidia bacterium]